MIFFNEFALLSFQLSYNNNCIIEKYNFLIKDNINCLYYFSQKTSVDFSPMSCGTSALCKNSIALIISEKIFSVRF